MSSDDEHKKKKYYKYCSNCGKNGHEFKDCKNPITSYGIILLSFNQPELLNEESINGDINNFEIGAESDGIRGKNIKEVEIFSTYKNTIKFLLIRRKHTLGYIEFIRGRYKIDNIDGIIFLFQQMTRDEIKKIEELSFDELWNDLWGNSEKKNLFIQEYQKASTKFNELKTNNTELGLAFYVKNVSPAWDQAEWGFPKGRKNKTETNLESAIREFEEESNINEIDYKIINEIKPLIEEFIGTNGVKYKHIYYVAMYNSKKRPEINPTNTHQSGEIGAIGFYTYDELIQMIRPYHIERKKLITRLYMYLINKIISNFSNIS